MSKKTNVKLLVAGLFILVLIVVLTQMTIADNPNLKLRLDQTVTFENNQITWVRVEDSRCPEGANCIWAGEVKVYLQIQEGSQEPESLVLKQSTKIEEENFSNMTLSLKSVEPYPKLDVEYKKSQYVAVIQIRKTDLSD